MKKRYSNPCQSLAKSVTLALVSVALVGGVILNGNLSSLAAPKPVSKPAAAQKQKPGAKPAAAASKPAASTAVAPEVYAQVSALELLKKPESYLNQQVELVGVFNRFSDTGLDYKKAFRDSRDYVSLFILRPDVEPHTIPLSELKLFFPRKKSDDVTNLEGGDTVRIRGKVFSTALDEPWIDITDIKILQKTKESTKKPGDDCC